MPKTPNPLRLKLYRTLGEVPGPVGRRYDRKLGKALRGVEFAEALARSHDLYGIDLGANIGKYTRAMAAQCHHVYAFEPDPLTAARLRDNTDDLANLTLEEAAIGTESGSIKLFRRSDFSPELAETSEGSSVFAEKSNIDRSTAIEVRQIDFLDFVRGLDRDVGVLKIDIEGAEVDLLEALLGAPDVLGRIHAIFAETHEDRIRTQRERVRALQRRVRYMQAPRINLYWN